MRICVVIPAYYEGATIGELVRRLLPLVSEVVVIDDGSGDDTSAAARKAGATVLRHEKNRGKGAALKTGFDYAVKTNFDAVITMDGDGQHDWREVPLFINEAENGKADIILGTRMGSVKGMPFLPQA